MRKDKHLDAAPLLAWVTARGGVAAALRQAGLQPGTPRFKQYGKSIDRAAAAGTLTVYLADDIAVNVLGVHPATIYGRAWEASPDTARVAS